jgi:Icc-related predicted phosphoesterase
MKLTCISDIHCRYREIEVPDADMLVIAGDVCNWGLFPEFDDFCRWVFSLRGRFKHIVYVPGNHDKWVEKNLDKARKMLAPCHLITNGPLEIERFKLWGYAYIPPMPFWAFSQESNKAKVMLDAIPEGLDLLISHGPPFATLDSTLNGYNVGCPLLREAVDRAKPRHHVFGHIHEGYGEIMASCTTFHNVAICDRFYNPINKPTQFDL